MSKLKDIRLKNKISQEQLAVDVGVTVRYIAFLESGKRKPSIDVAFKIAKALQTTVDNIFLDLFLCCHIRFIFPDFVIQKHLILQ